MRSMRRTVAFFSLVVLLLPACGGDDDGSSDADAAPDPDGGEDATSPCPDGSDPVVFEFGTSVDGVIDEPGNRDHYVVTAAAGSWIVIDTLANEEKDAEKLDTVVRLYDPDGELIAMNDDQLPLIHHDSELITRLDAAGDYCVEVVDFRDIDDNPDVPEVGDDTFTYTLVVVEIDPDSPAVTIDPEDGDDADSAAELTLGTTTMYILGELRADDVDFFEFTIPEDAVESTFYGHVMPAGVGGNGSTATAGRLVIENLDPETIAVISHASGQKELSPPLRSGTHLLSVAAPGGDPGSNAFYVIKAQRGTDNTPEEEGETGNDTFANAQPVVPTEITGSGGVRGAFVITHLQPFETDRDYFSFDVNEGEIAEVGCAAQSIGSGIRELIVSLRDDADAEVMSQDEDPVAGVSFTTDALSAGTYALRVLAQDGDTTIVSRFVRCGVRLRAF